MFIVAALSPIIAIILATLGKQFAPLTETLLALLLVHTGLLLEVAYMNNKALHTFSEVGGTKVKSISQNRLWTILEGKKTENFDILALNGGMVAKCIRNRDVRVGNIRIIVPSAQALEVFFADLEPTLLQDRMNQLSIGEVQFRKITDSLLHEKKVRNVEIRTSAFFSGRVALLPSGANIAVGRYVRDEENEVATGLQITTFLEDRKDIIKRERDSFQALWDSLESGE